ncbi:MAG: PH domain-containing protein [Planctomycetes bacterium]|nr:PH domain-containing protein [Planctomycetota bacterium]
MITIACDNCEREFFVETAEAGGKVKCPDCGDVNRVPEPGPAQDAAADADAPQPGDANRPAGKGLPPDHGPEQDICVIRPAMFRAHPFRGLLLLSLLVGGGVLVILAMMPEAVPPQLAGLGVVMMLAAAVWWVVWFVSAHLWVKLRISNKRTIRRDGIIRRHTSEVLHDHVRNVEIRQTIIQRVFNVGYLGISSSGQDGIEIEILDIPEPYKVKALIDEYRDM